jgi:hypothetical protein
MVKYPVQCMIGGTLLLTLAFSLDDGSVAQNDSSSKLSDRIACGGPSAPPVPSLRGEGGVGDGCLGREAKK